MNDTNTPWRQDGRVSPGAKTQKLLKAHSTISLLLYSKSFTSTAGSSDRSNVSRFHFILFQGQGQKNIFLRVCWLKAKVWKNLSRSLIVWLSSTNYWSCRDPPDSGGRKRTQNLSLSFTDFLPILCVSNLWFSFIWIDMAMTGLMMATVLMMVMMTLLLWSDGINESGSQLLLLHFLFLSHAVSLFFHM